MSVLEACRPKGSDRPPGAGTGSLKGDDIASCQVIGPAATKPEHRRADRDAERAR